MPIFHKTIISPPKKIEPIYEREIKLHLEDLIESCICNHLDTGHVLLVGKCGYDYCDCMGFIPKEFEILVPITNADIFEHEVEDHPERESLNWWNEFNSWKEKNEK